MPRPEPDLARIARLRELFFDERRTTGALEDYWRDRKDLQAYDAVLGARIGWKWDAALAECEDRGFARADDDVVVDFGCGAGVAARRFVARFGAKEVLCYDRSKHARKFAVERLAAEQPEVPARAVPSTDGIDPDVLLVSHVLGELDADGDHQLRELIARSRRVIIVEPGNRPTSRRLSQLRDELLAADAERHHVIAPCPHANSCPSLVAARDWCHFFATPPQVVFTDGWWAKVTRALNIDVRSLPYAFLALARQPAPHSAPPSRALGRAQITPHLARLRQCGPDGLDIVEITKRHDAATWRALKKRPEQVRSLPGGRDPDEPTARV